MDRYLDRLIHEWSQVVTMLGYILVPLFGILDYCTLPSALVPRFLAYRGWATLVVLAQYFVIRRTRPGPASYLHGYFFSLVVGGTIVQMTLELGGFNSSYYAGLNLVIVAVNIFLPWRALHSAINGMITVALYLVVNGLWGGPFDVGVLVNNLYFMCGTLVIAVAINHSRNQLIIQEYRLREELLDANRRLDSSRQELREARDALWGEMEVAKHIQTALLPRNQRVGPFQVHAVMHPAAAVGGDYYDIMETAAGERWVAIGDVSGHGVESGLVMMMTQTSIYTLVNTGAARSPAEIYAATNLVLRENIKRLQTQRYVTLNLLRLEADGIWVAGKHQDILVWRAASGRVETVGTSGCWLGVVADAGPIVQDQFIPLHAGDLVLLYTDGISEAASTAGELFGDHRLAAALERHAGLPLEAAVEAILADVNAFQARQDDDMTLVLIRDARPQ